MCCTTVFYSFDLGLEVNGHLTTTELITQNPQHRVSQ